MHPYEVQFELVFYLADPGMIESVAVRQRGAYDFETHYENLCALQSSCPMAAVKAHLGEGVMDINGDRVKLVQNGSLGISRF